MNDQLMILLCGFYCLGFAVFHAFFWKLFNWKHSLSMLQPYDKAIMQISNMRLIYLFLFVAAICFCFPDELASTPLGNFFLMGMSLFWLGRTVEQFLFLKVENKWVHLLTYLFLIGAIMFAIPVLVKSYS